MHIKLKLISLFGILLSCTLLIPVCLQKASGFAKKSNQTNQVICTQPGTAAEKSVQTLTTQLTPIQRILTKTTCKNPEKTFNQLNQMIRHSLYPLLDQFKSISSELLNQQEPKNYLANAFNQYASNNAFYNNWSGSTKKEQDKIKNDYYSHFALGFSTLQRSTQQQCGFSKRNLPSQQTFTPSTLKILTTCFQNTTDQDILFHGYTQKNDIGVNRSLFNSYVDIINGVFTGSEPELNDFIENEPDRPEKLTLIRHMTGIISPLNNLYGSIEKLSTKKSRQQVIDAGNAANKNPRQIKDLIETDSLSGTSFVTFLLSLPTYEQLLVEFQKKMKTFPFHSGSEKTYKKLETTLFSLKKAFGSIRQQIKTEPCIKNDQSTQEVYGPIWDTL